MTLFTPAPAPPQKAIAPPIPVPRRTRRFLPVATLPPTVSTRLMSGRPPRTAWEMAAAVEAFTTTQPTSMGSPPDGTWRPVSTWTSCFSLPCGYFVRIGQTCTSVPAAWRRHAMASGLLSSTPMYSALAPTMCAASRSPSTTAPCLLHHYPVVRAQKRLALRAVEEHRVDGLVLRRRELHVRRERRTAQADDACLADGPQQPGRVVHIPYRRQRRVPLIQAVVPDNHRRHATPAGYHARLYALDPARDRRVHRGADIPVGAPTFCPMYTRSPRPSPAACTAPPHAAKAAPPPPPAPACPQPPSHP